MLIFENKDITFVKGMGKNRVVEFLFLFIFYRRSIEMRRFYGEPMTESRFSTVFKAENVSVNYKVTRTTVDLEKMREVEVAIDLGPYDAVAFFVDSSMRDKFVVLPSVKWVDYLEDYFREKGWTSHWSESKIRRKLDYFIDKRGVHLDTNYTMMIMYHLGP